MLKERNTHIHTHICIYVYIYKYIYISLSKIKTVKCCIISCFMLQIALENSEKHIQFLKLYYTGCTNTNIISHWPWLYLFKTPELNVGNNCLFTFNSSVFLDFKVFFPPPWGFLSKYLYTFVISNTETCTTLFISQNFSPVT